LHDYWARDEKRTELHFVVWTVVCLNSDTKGRLGGGDDSNTSTFNNNSSFFSFLDQIENRKRTINSTCIENTGCSIANHMALVLKHRVSVCHTSNHTKETEKGNM